MSYKMSWQYIAGFFDGEGCICHSISNNGYKRYDISMSQKPIKVLKIIRIFLLRHDIESKIHKDKCTGVHVVTISGRINKAMFLNRILPYLIVKKDKAEECLEWIKNCHAKGGLHLIEKRKIEELRNLGLTQGQIGKEIGRSQRTIYSYCRKEDLLN